MSFRITIIIFYFTKVDGRTVPILLKRMHNGFNGKLWHISSKICFKIVIINFQIVVLSDSHRILILGLSMLLILLWYYTRTLFYIALCSLKMKLLFTNYEKIKMHNNSIQLSPSRVF